MSSQEVFLARVRRALQAGHASADHFVMAPQLTQESSEIPAGWPSRQQEPTPTLVARLQEELRTVGGLVLRAQSVAEATQYITQLAIEKAATLVVRWPSALLDTLEIDAALRQRGIEVQTTSVPPDEVNWDSEATMDARRQELRALLARAEIGLSGVDCAIAATGTLVLSALPGQMRSVSLLPPVHVAVVRRAQIVATMADYLGLLSADSPNLQQRLTSCVSFITGPSRTGDIELSLTVGVHGPGELHLVILDEPEAPGDGPE
jgi:L-lactate dehydrogenase complex protein LldG